MKNDNKLKFILFLSLLHSTINLLLVKYVPVNSTVLLSAFYFILKAPLILLIFWFLYFLLFLFFEVIHCLKSWLKINLKVYDVINCWSKNFKKLISWEVRKIWYWSFNQLTWNRYEIGNMFNMYNQKICSRSNYWATLWF